MRRLVIGAFAFAVVAGGLLAFRYPPRPGGDLSRRVLDGPSLDGSGNNLVDPSLGQAGLPYPRLTGARYADGVAAMADGPDPRFISNRIFNDGNQNVFSPRGVSQWGFVWGQFLDHTFGKRLEADEEAAIAFDPADPLEAFRNDLGNIAFERSAAAAGTGQKAVREQVNTVSSYIDAWAVYGGTAGRLDWLRAGPADGDPTNNRALLPTDDGYLPTAASRPGVNALAMDLMGRLMTDPSVAVVAGDVRANENLALTAVQTLFVREHNRIVAALPDGLPEEEKFDIARRVVAAEQQWITYTEFLPAMASSCPRTAATTRRSTRASRTSSPRWGTGRTPRSTGRSIRTSTSRR